MDAPALDLDALIAAITPQNRHAPVDWGPPVGKEVWPFLTPSEKEEPTPWSPTV
ncbi:hypothetical protein D3C85_1919390 [compost metagenome]